MTPLVIAVLAVGALLLLTGSPPTPPTGGIDAINRLLAAGGISGTTYTAGYQVPGFVPTTNPPTVPHLRSTPPWNAQLGTTLAPAVPVGIAGVMATAYNPNTDAISRAAPPTSAPAAVNPDASSGWHPMPATLDQVPRVSTLPLGVSTWAGVTKPKPVAGAATATPATTAPTRTGWL